MSTKYNPTHTNKVPWTDALSLISIVATEDSDGYVTKTETSRTIFCTFIEGVARSEFYEAMKAGIKLSAQCEVWDGEYLNEEFAEYNNTRYRVIRTFPTGRGTVQLNLEEVVR